MWLAECCDDSRKTKSARLLAVNTLPTFSVPLSIKLCDTLCHNAALPSFLSIAITLRARSLGPFLSSPDTADKKHAAGINLSGLPVTQLRHIHPARYITYCVLTLKYNIYYTASYLNHIMSIWHVPQFTDITHASFISSQAVNVEITLQTIVYPILHIRNSFMLMAISADQDWVQISTHFVIK